ncbi:MAG: hypothetical protein R2813_10670 [Flavobacteriales bacterium]
MGIIIQKAWYGYSGEVAHDVTAAVQAKIPGTNNISFEINQANLGLSGLSNNPRQLTVTYAYGTLPGPGSTVISKSGLDGQTMKLNYAPPYLIFSRVTYGTDKVFIDITKAMQEAIFTSTDNMIFTIGSGQFLERIGGDPALGVPKVCSIYYTLNGTTQECIMARDGDQVNLNVGP